MMRKYSLSALLVLLFALVACSAAGEITGYDSFVKALEGAGATVEEGDALSQPFLSVEGRALLVNGADLQVFSYPSDAAAQADAGQISPDGSSTATTMITWIATPHFFQAGGLIVLYVGDDAATLDLLESLLGPQFAGG